MKDQKKLIDLCKSKGYDKFHPQWFENNKLDPGTWYLELCLLQKWLREKYHFHIAIMPWDKTYWWYQIEDIDAYDSSKGALIKAESEEDKLYNSYEEALEAGLYQALKLIK